MKNKKGLIILVVLAVIQLAFSVGYFAYEKSVEKSVIEKGESYTLRYMNITNFNKSSMSLDTDEIYAVGYETDWDVAEEYYEDENYIYSDTVSLYSKVLISKNADGSIMFYDAETKGAELTDSNWFSTFDVFHPDPADYEFVSEDFGMKELFDLGMLLSKDKDENLTYEEFMRTDDGYYKGIWSIPLDGTVTLKVYKGIGIIDEIYIGDQLIMKHK